MGSTRRRRVQFDTNKASGRHSQIHSASASPRESVVMNDDCSVTISGDDAWRDRPEGAERGTSCAIRRFSSSLTVYRIGSPYQAFQAFALVDALCTVCATFLLRWSSMAQPFLTCFTPLSEWHISSPASPYLVEDGGGGRHGAAIKEWFPSHCHRRYR